jgi:SAM-dependent methyltransferase
VNDVHPTAAAGFDAAASGYDRHRPGYPSDALSAIIGQLEGSPPRVLDLGAGTGKLTRPLVEAGAQVIAVEPVAAMGDALSAALPDVEVVRAAAEALPLADGSLDAVTAGQAFHWFDAPRALAEIHRVLRPGGLLAVIFNRRDLDTALQTEIDGLLAPYRGATPSWGDHGWRRALGSPTGFTAPEHLEFPNRQQVDADGLIGRVASVSFVATLPPEERAELDRELLRIFATHESDGSVTLAYRTELWRLRRER